MSVCLVATGLLPIPLYAGHENGASQGPICAQELLVGRGRIELPQPKARVLQTLGLTTCPTDPRRLVAVPRGRGTVGPDGMVAEDRRWVRHGGFLLCTVIDAHRPVGGRRCCRRAGPRADRDGWHQTIAVQPACAEPATGRSYQRQAGPMGRPYGSMLPTIALRSSLVRCCATRNLDDPFVASAAIALADRGQPIDPLPLIEGWAARAIGGPTSSRRYRWSLGP